MQKNTISSFYRTTLACLLLSLVFATSNVQAQALVYHEVSGDNEYYYYYSFSEVADGFNISVARTQNGDTLDKHVLVTGPDFKTRSWHYKRSGEHTDVFASLTADGVLIKGFLDGDELDELEELDDDEPWIQLFPLNPGFEKFVFSDEDEIVFWSIGTESPADMEIASFSAEKEERGYNKEFGCNVLRINFGPTGWKSLFWDGDYYFRITDGRLMGYRGDGAPGKPSAKTTLIKEN